MAKEVSNKLNISLPTVVLAYKSFWNNIKEHIEEMQINNIEKDQNQSHMPMSFNIPSFGKLYTNQDKINSINNRKNRREDIKY